ncbi:hypothetical protein I547_3812 [Mycobacterium kansasii 824]|nr:hypothetical protein I547_3812 [Mycobacterium kansasii 824]
MQPKVGVVRVGGDIVQRADDGADRDDFGAAIVVAADQRDQLGGMSDSANREVPLLSDSVSSGAGNQVSRTDPSAARVARPMPAAPVTPGHATCLREQTQNRTPSLWGVRFCVCSAL